jgi:hypothetical protein
LVWKRGWICEKGAAEKQRLFEVIHNMPLYQRRAIDLLQDFLSDFLDFLADSFIGLLDWKTSQK